MVLKYIKSNRTECGVMAESADASDLKSGEGNLVWVQVPLAPPFLKKIKKSVAFDSQFCYYNIAL